MMCDSQGKTSDRLITRYGILGIQHILNLTEIAQNEPKVIRLNTSKLTSKKDYSKLFIRINKPLQNILCIFFAFTRIHFLSSKDGKKLTLEKRSAGSSPGLVEALSKVVEPESPSGAPHWSKKSLHSLVQYNKIKKLK